MDRPPGREPGRRPRERPDPAGRRRRRRHALPGPRHRGHVPDERPVPRDRGIVPALRHPLPARRRHAVLRPARGQGRARLPADPALRHGQRQLRADHQRPGARRSATRPSRSCARPRPREDGIDLGRDRGGRARRARRRSRRGPGARSPTSRRSSGGCGRGSASWPCPSCSTRPSRRPATGRCSPTARRTARSAGRTCSSCARSRPATTT